MTTPNSSSSNALDSLIDETMRNGGEITPPKDLWRGIEASISRQQLGSQLQVNNNRRWVIGVAASLFVAIGVFMGTHHVQKLSPGNRLQTEAQMKLLTMVTQQHQQQRELLLSNYQDAGFTPSFSELEVELQQLREAAIKVTQQLQQEPNNLELWKFLQWLHQQELELLKTMYMQPRTYRQV
ncbi:hypothetical protein NOG12_00060 [Pseudidiomarina sp. GXY010]|uniref:Anti-sigma factor n=1 Tax=Pseudidiomarina fusca TaxID=2965078 RepID=A0ABU3KSL8_9GAMM|nr:hypothetical protein [Pseudidiomarina sp. GXY010]MDT7524500.1 hypothetical protein [Pseudidiomarina sp. GXY010]